MTKAENKTEIKITKKAKPEPEIKETVVPEEILVENEGKVGGILKQARIRQGKKIPDIAQSLCIRKAYLEAIEDSRYDAIPEPPYGLGFIRSYAEYLGEDSSQIARMYKAETDAKFNGENKMYVLEPQEEATVPSKKYLLISLLAIMIIYFLWLAFNNYHNNASAPEVEPTNVETSADVDAEFPLVVEDYAPVEEAVAEPESETMLVSESQENNTSNETTQEANDSTAAESQVIEAAPVEEVENKQVVVNEGSFTEEKNQSEPKEEIEPQTQVEKASEPAPIATAPAPGKSNIVLKIKKETWVEVKNSEKLYLSKVLMPGTSYALPKAEGLILSVGRVDGVDIFVGDQQVNIVKPNKKTNIVLEEALKNLNH